MKTIIAIFAAMLLTGATPQQNSHYYIVTSRIMFAKQVMQKAINVEKCHPGDPDVAHQGKSLVQVIELLESADYEMISHTSAYASTVVVERLIFKQTADYKLGFN